MRLILCLLLLNRIHIVISYSLRMPFLSIDRRFALQEQSILRTPTTATSDVLQNKLQLGGKFVFVGGKGGVGKTTSSSAIALASSDRGYRTLVVSTDPAHSLGDALDIDLSSGKVVPVNSKGSLCALEIDVETALQEFKNSVENFDTESIAKGLGIPREIVASFGIQDIADIFVNPPPGTDEIVALAKIFQYAESTDAARGGKFDRIVIDTAPSGHTLRLLQLPQFLNTVTGKLLKLRAKIYNAVEMFQGFFGGGASGTSPGAKIGSILDKLDNLQTSISQIQRTLKDSGQTQFVIVTIPTILAVAESKRLLSSLQSEGISVSNIVCNQVLSPFSDLQYMKTRSVGQQKCIESMLQFVQTMPATARAGVSESHAPPPPIEGTEVPFVDTEVRGVFGLRFFHSLAHPVKARSATNPMDSRKLTIFGGKGGVGKTTSAASWAVRLADSGYRTLLVSSDPAHSLGDALQMPLSGTPRPVDLCTGSVESGELWAMEIDPSVALEEFKCLIRTNTQTAAGTAGSNSGGPGAGRGGGGILSSLGLPDLGSELSEMLFGIQEPPPGTDEVVALAKVIEYLDNGYTVNGRTVKFDRIVLDTAPTGHTLRMLQLPQFIQQTVSKLRVIRGKTQNVGGMLGMFGGNDYTVSASALPAESDTLYSFQARMKRLESVLHSPKDCEFTAVTIPTELATAETKRLLGALQGENILVRRLIINQVLPVISGAGTSGDGASEASAYLNKLRAGQQSALAELRTMAAGANASLIEVPYFDTEVRTVYGLRVVSNAIVSDTV